MKPNEEFIIEDGTLERYAGPGGDVAIPAGVKTIAEEAFQGNVRLRSVRFPDREMDLEAAVFAKCTGLKHVKLPRKASLSLARTFYGCRSLEEIQLSATQASVGQYCFYRCTALRHVSMQRVETIGTAAFSGCRSLKDVRFPPTLRTLGYRAFHHCPGLEEIGLPAGLERIGTQAFARCSGIREIVVPDGVRRIGGEAFAHCTGLERVVLPRGPVRLGDGVFDRCPRLKAKNIDWPGHTDAEKRELLACHDYSIDRSRLSDPISREIARMERVERGFCENDWANLGDYLLVLLPDMLREFADRHVAYPMGMTYEQWHGILREMDSHFRSARTWLVSDSRHDMLDALVGRCAGQPGTGAPPPDLPPKLVRLLGKTRLDDQRAREEAMQRLFNHELQAGFGLFQRYFLHLWD